MLAFTLVTLATLLFARVLRGATEHGALALHKRAAEADYETCERSARSRIIGAAEKMAARS